MAKKGGKCKEQYIFKEETNVFCNPDQLTVYNNKS